MVKTADVVLIIVSILPMPASTLIICNPQVAILFPPAAAGFLTGCSCDLLINIALTMCVLQPW